MRRLIGVWGLGFRVWGLKSLGRRGGTANEFSNNTDLNYIISATDPDSDGRAPRFFPSLATRYESFVRGFLFRLLERCLE